MPIETNTWQYHEASGTWLCGDRFRGCGVYQAHGAWWAHVTALSGIRCVFRALGPYTSAGVAQDEALRLFYELDVIGKLPDHEN